MICIFIIMKSGNFRLEENDSLFVDSFVKKSKEEFRAVMLLLLDKGMSNIEIADMLGVHQNTVGRIKNKYLKEGLKVALYDKPRSGQPKKYGAREEAEIIALACSDPPEGRKCWSIRLLTETLKGEEGFETINRETVRIILKKAKQNHGLKECGA
jgi:transposase